MSRKAHSFLHEYPRIRVDRFTESRERVPDFLLPPRCRAGAAKRQDEDEDDDEPGPWDDLDQDDESTLKANGGVRFFPAPTIQLLSHIHADHIEGLSAPLRSSAPIYCSAATKEMLMRLESQKSREKGACRVPMGEGARKRPYEWLRVTAKHAKAKKKFTGLAPAPRDLLHALPFNTPTELRYSPGVNIRITLLDANHMSGSTMFLIEGHRGAVLHMGDCRAETWWIEALVRHPSMQKYASWQDGQQQQQAETSSLPSRLGVTQSGLAQQYSPPRSETQITSTSSSSSRKTPTTPSQRKPSSVQMATGRDLRLQNIYVDDEWLSNAGWPPSKMDAAQDVVDLMKRYPEDTSFFIDCWTWGFEEVFLAIGKTLRDATGQGARVHVDPYKWSMYTLAGDRSLPFLTKTASATRFHACERTQECDHMWEDASLTIGESEAACHLVDHWTGPVHSVPLSRQEQEYYETQVRESAAQSSAAAGSSAVSPLTVYVKVLGTSIEEWATLRAQSHAEIDKAQRGEASYPAWLACPLQRHSCLPELQRLVRSFRPCTVTPTSSQEDHYFLASRLLGPYLGPGGQQRIEREAREATPSDVWRVCEERMPSGGLGDAGDWNEVLKKYHEARQPPLDLSQSGAVSKGRARDEEHEDADVSNSRVSASLPAPVASAPITSNPQVAVAAPSSSAAGPPSITSPSASGARILDDDLARRFFVVLRMCVVPHLKLLNVPGGTEGSEAWKAVRKLKPGWAATAERIMYKYTEVLGDEWACSAYVRDEVGQTRKRVKKESGANALAGPSRLAAAGGTSRGVGRQDEATTYVEQREADEDWLPLLLSQLDTQPSAPLQLVEDLCSASATHLAAIHAELELQAGVYGRVRTEAMQRVNGSAVLARQAGFIVEGLARSIALVGQGEGDDGVGMRRETFLRLVALTDVALQIAALLLGSGGVEGDIVDQLRLALVSCGEGLKRMLSSLEGGGLAWAQQEREDALVLLRRLEKTMRMAEEEAA